MDKLKRAQGNWVVGDRFWNRDQDIESFIGRIDEGAHVLLTGQRRMGKTSLMRETARRLKDRYICLQVDLQKARSAPDAVAELSFATHPYKNVWKKTSEIFQNVLGAVESVKVDELEVQIRAGLSSGNWSAKGDSLFDILAAADRPIVVFFDEISIVLNRLLKGEEYRITAERRKTADEFMSWLRANSIRHQGNIRIVLTGSIGIEVLLHQAGLSATVNNFVPCDLGPWDDEAAIGCLRALANEYGVLFQDGAREEILRQLGSNIPHHVQMFFDQVYETCQRRDSMECTVKDVKNIYKERMLGTRGHAELSHYEERLKKALGTEVFPLAVDLLTETAITRYLCSEAADIIRAEYPLEGRDPADAQREILEVFQHDGYLRKGPKGYVFVSKLIRDWWKSHYEFSFTPALKRRI